jgi:DNA-directed RNA polymerase subunit alpha
VAQFQVECIESTIDKDQSQYSRFILEPLDRGQGSTIGNALRRVLLSNLEGTAVTAIRLDGVSHEFSVVPGVREDVLDIMLNMKKVVLKSYTSQPQIGRLVVQGPAVVTAANFDLPSEVDVISTDQYIATVAPGAKLEMEFQVQRGKGYRSVDRIREDQSTSVDFLQVDSIFMPVRKVNYTVENTRMGGSIDRDRLLMEVWTNGSLTQEALGQAANILVDLFNPLKDVNFEASEDDLVTDKPDEHQIPIEELQLSVRAYNCLKRAQINSVSDLLDYTQEDLMEIKNFGAKSAEEVVEALKDRLGITLPLTKAAKENGGI